ncbi:MAG TPA: phosphoglucomutase/phosphomannomutase family protein [Trueperaceae bacterium]|nr:phosphoglucomutase/phosphomannomutase family protein [Trueperaceae bacterium]
MEPQSESLVFGTDGWRDVFADRFTFANLRRAARAYGEHLLERSAAGSPVLVGYDTRFMGRRFALEVAAVLRSLDLDALVSRDYLPTPALSFAVKHLGARGGVMLTASHNPPQYGGFKLKGAYGGTATDDIYRDVERRVGQRTVPAPTAAERDAVGDFDVRKQYYEALAQLVDLDALRRADATLVHDPMGGAGCGWLRGFATATRALRVEETRGRPDPLFHGVNPEPIPGNLLTTQELMQSSSGRAGSDPVFAVATDGDGDRLGVVLPGGEYFNSHQIFAVLLSHLERTRRPAAAAGVVKTFTVSRIVERLARARGLPVVETPVGFKYIVDAMLAGDVIIGGEESGGIGVGMHLPERDGLANALLLLEAVVSAGEPLAEIFAALERETGWQHAYRRVDLQLAGDGSKERVLAQLADPPASFGGWGVASVEDLDGVKLNLSRHEGAEPTAWLLLRASGTEPVLRLYCEAPSTAAVKQILAAAEAFVAVA